jgi:hypothetical protein
VSVTRPGYIIDMAFAVERIQPEVSVLICPLGVILKTLEASRNDRKQAQVPDIEVAVIGSFFPPGPVLPTLCEPLNNGQAKPSSETLALFGGRRPVSDQVDSNGDGPPRQKRPVFERFKRFFVN